MDRKEFCTDLQQLLIAYHRSLVDFEHFLGPSYLASEHKGSLPDIRHMADNIENLFGHIFKKFKIREMQQLYKDSFYREHNVDMDALALETNIQLKSRRVFKQFFTVRAGVKKLPHNLSFYTLIIDKDATLEELPDDIKIGTLHLRKGTKLLGQVRKLVDKGQIGSILIK